MPTLPNAELLWEKSAELREYSREQIERCIGPCSESVELLSGGLANINLRIGGTRVLRIYRRDASALPKEAMLLRQEWKSFRSPALLEVGDDFLLLEYVEHTPLPDTEKSGEFVGQALAEIHTQTFEVHGDFDATGAVPSPMHDFAAELRDHAKAEIAKGPPQYRDLAKLAHDHLDAKYDTLAALCEAPRRLHGDFKASNLHLSADGRLLVLDWEFAYAGPTMMDVGQLLRWSPSDEFLGGFSTAYKSAGGHLPEDWRATSSLFDLANLAGLLRGSEVGSRRAVDVATRVRATLGLA